MKYIDDEILIELNGLSNLIKKLLSCCFEKLDTLKTCSDFLRLVHQ